jgi:hypothetical protein
VSQDAGDVMPEAMRVLLDVGVRVCMGRTGLLARQVVCAAAGGGTEEHRIRVGLALGRGIPSADGTYVLARVMRWYGGEARREVWAERSGQSVVGVAARLKRGQWYDYRRQAREAWWCDVRGQWPEVVEARAAARAKRWARGEVA